MYLFTVCCFYSLLIPKKVEGYYIEIVIAYSSSNVLQNIIYIGPKIPLILRCTIILYSAYKEKRKPTMTVLYSIHYKLYHAFTMLKM